MAEIISIRVVLFFVAFFLLRFAMFAVMPRPSRWHALILLAVSTLSAFVVGALVLDDPLGDTLVAWAVIYLIIAVLWFARWKGQDYERVHPSRVPDQVAREQAVLDPEEVEARRRRE